MIIQPIEPMNDPYVISQLALPIIARHVPGRMHDDVILNRRMGIVYHFLHRRVGLSPKGDVRFLRRQAGLLRDVAEKQI